MCQCLYLFSAVMILCDCPGTVLQESIYFRILMVCVKSSAVLLHAPWSRQMSELLVYLITDSYLCCGIFYDRMLKQRLIFFSLQRRPVLVTAYFLYFSLCLDKHWPWLTLVWCFWKACLSEIWHWWPFTNHCWASKECISFCFFKSVNFCLFYCMNRKVRLPV